MHSPPKPSAPEASSPHAPDDRSGSGVRLLSERERVLVKVARLLGAHADGDGTGLELSGVGWLERLAAAVEALTPAERDYLYAVGADERNRLPAPARVLVQRLRTDWFPGLLQRDALVPHFQPVLDLRSGCVFGYEALARAEVDGRLVGGFELVAAAEAHDAVFSFDRCARRAAIRRGVAQVAPGETLFVNFAPAALQHAEATLASTVVDAEREGLSLGRLCIEVTVPDSTPTSELMEAFDRCRELGVRVAVDLGAAGGALIYRRELVPDVVKLGRALVGGLREDPARRRLVTAMVEYAHELGMRVAAVGVETAGELDAVHEAGADFAQGWYFGRPAERPVIVSWRLTRARG